MRVPEAARSVVAVRVLPRADRTPAILCQQPGEQAASARDNRCSRVMCFWDNSHGDAAPLTAPVRLTGGVAVDISGAVIGNFATLNDAREALLQARRQRDSLAHDPFRPDCVCRAGASRLAP